MQNMLKEKKYFLILVLFLALGAFLLFFNPRNKDVKVTEDEVVKEEIKITSSEQEITEDREDSTSVSLGSPNPKQDKFNQAILDGDKAFLIKDYQQSIIHYNKALSHVNSQIAYMRLFNTYNVMGDTNKAIEAIDKAIALKPMFADYWNTKIQYLDEKTSTPYQDLKKIYNEGLLKVNPQTKLNLVISFARIAENNKEKSEAIKLWQKAIELNPTMKAAYQSEIDALNK